MRESANASARIAPALLGWIGGTALHLQWRTVPTPAEIVLGLALVLLMGALAHRRDAAGAAVGTALACAALAFSVCGLRVQAQAAHALNPRLEGRDLQLTGTVATLPQRSPDGLRFIFDVDTAQAGEAPVRVPPRIGLGWWAPTAGEGAGPPPLQAGERWRLMARLKAPHGLLNPHGYDAELRLWEQGVQATGSVRAGPPGAAPERLPGRAFAPVERARQRVRDAILAQVSDARAAGVVAALVTGDQDAIAQDDWALFRATGVAHLMSISGLHVTMFAWLAAAVVGRAWRRSQRLCLACAAANAARLAGVALAAAYALFSGWGVPAQRTVIMLAVAALLGLGGRRWPWPVVWLAAAAAVLAADPWALLQAGFWLSFVAVGVLFASDTGRPRDAATGLGRRAGRALAGMVREQAVVTLALAPLTLLLFQQVSLVGLLANLLAIPWVTLAVLPPALLGVVAPPLWSLAAWGVQLLGALLEAMAAWPLATWSRPAVPGAVLLALRLPLHLRALGLPLVLPALLWQPARPAPGGFDLLAADVGQGNAVLLRTAGHSLLYDAGPRYTGEADAGGRVLVPLLRALGESPDLLLLSHRDSDHTGGAAAVLATQLQAGLLASLEPEHPLWRLRGADTRRPCVAGERWVWDGVRFEILHPPQAATAGPRPNTQSCVLRVVAASGVAALLAGDIERAQEAALLDAGTDLRADWLLAPHHGSNTSSSARWLAAVAPRVAVAQAGYRNRFGHPAQQALARYAAQGVPVVASPACGALRWQSATPAHWVCERDLRQRYWHHRAP